MSRNNMIVDIKYLCSCDPTANVAVEIPCGLVHGKTLEDVKTIKEDAFCEVLTASSEDLRKKANGLLELLNRGIMKFQAAAA
jgi:hypothetical protein